MYIYIYMVYITCFVAVCCSVRACGGVWSLWLQTADSFGHILMVLGATHTAWLGVACAMLYSPRGSFALNALLAEKVVANPLFNDEQTGCVNVGNEQ